MKKIILVITLVILIVAPCLGEKIIEKDSNRPIHTYSIVARDPDNGQLGVAVQSHWFSVGHLVPWVEAGVGAVATQSFVEASYGPLGLDLMRAGKSAPQVLKALVEIDPKREVRQVAMIDSQGMVAAHTGNSCIIEAGHYTGNQFSVQANLMLKNTVWKAMADAYQSTKGDLIERLMAALEAAEKEGGDIRGRQSAAIIVVSGKPSGQLWRDRIIDLRVEDHPDPILELKRLVKVHRAYELMNRGDEYLAQENVEAALKEYSAAEQLTPDNVEMVFWHAVTLADLDRVEESLPLFKKVFKADYNWAVLLPRLPKSGLLPDKPELVKKIISVAPKRK
ncbi:MAG: DUF1028 domain-containing protein [Candidatus Aminicenantes bacterium]|nr:DUF1028 domain-containing protein [Candidatus Aminicenantes bacterium]